MNTSNIDTKTDSDLNKAFWDSLQLEILNSKKAFSVEDISSYVEKSFMFSLFFRGTSHKELSVFRSILDFKDLGYLILIEVLPKDNDNIVDFDIDELSLYYFIKNNLPDLSTAIGPMIHNRFSIMVTDGPEALAPGKDFKPNSISVVTNLLLALENEFQIKLIAGIGNAQSIHTIYTSFLEALSCLPYCNPGEIIHVQDLSRHDRYHIYEYKEAENHMIEAVHHRKPDAYDYFLMMMNRISQLNDNAKRNKIIEALVLASHASRIDGMDEVDYIDYTSHINTLIKLSGNELIEWAFQKFVDITGFVKKPNAIDYSNKIVQATKEYLEAHYAEEISLEDVAEYVNISPQYFSKLIKKNTGFNFIDWLSMLRVKKAKELLTNSNLTVKEVCFMVGYKDPNYFSRIFKKKIGLTPSEYIKKNTQS
ncbi:MAG: helix-turn-helix transcriptional regulator [Clostridiales bacterium]|jgi:two-component system response regulator YesN|nr:helix-turn-helix transcriptional regulator [Clostridiales bacterium]